MAKQRAKWKRADETMDGYAGSPEARNAACRALYTHWNIVEHKKTPTDTNSIGSVGVISPEIVRRFSLCGLANSIARQ